VRVKAGWPKNIVANHPLEVAIVVPSLTLAVLVLATNPRFAGPDDVFYQLGLNGTLWLEPTGDVLVIRPLLTDALEWLHRRSIDTPWYIAIQLVMQLVAWMLLVYAFLTHRVSRTWFGWVLAGAVAIGLGFRLWMTMQYTSTAALLITAGVALHASSEEPDRWSRRTVVGAFAVGIGGLLRWEMLPVLLLVTGPWLMLARPVLDRTRAHALFLAIALVVTGLGWFHQEVKYQDDEAWEQYLEYNAVRGRLSDSPGLHEFEGVSAAMAARGWTDNDVELLTRFSMVDPVVFSQANLEALKEEIGGSARSIGGAIEAVEVLHPLSFLVAAMVGIVALVVSDRKGRWILVGSGSVVAVLGSYGAIYEHMPFYVPISLVFVLAVIAVFQDSPGTQRAAVAGVASVLLVLVSAVSVADMVMDSDRNKDLSDGFIAYLEQLHEFDPDGTFFLQAPDPIRHVGPLEIGSIPDIDIFVGTWFVGSPQYEQRVASLGRGSVMDIVLADPNVYLVTDSSRIVEYQTFIDDHIPGGGSLIAADRQEFDDLELVALTGTGESDG
jgi:hypothetical protein